MTTSSRCGTEIGETYSCQPTPEMKGCTEPYQQTQASDTKFCEVKFMFLFDIEL
jgi:hypothetical protein